MANARGKTVDKTFLSLNTAEDRGFIHRDYISHCLRWSHFLKRMYERKNWQTARILDVGCGRELPLAKMLYSNKLIPAAYFGIDAGPINDEDYGKLKGDMANRSEVWNDTNFLTICEQDFVDQRDGVLKLANYVVSFEVLEHVEPKMMLDMLDHMRALTTADARFFISTPCWNRTDCADNHVNEMTYEALGAVFEANGFVVENVHGTFASIKDYEDKLSLRHNCDRGSVPGWKDLFDALRSYYDTNFLSCIFAPLFPAQSRNCLWELSKGSAKTKKFKPLDECSRPWGSSAKWEEMQR